MFPDMIAGPNDQLKIEYPDISNRSLAGPKGERERNVKSSCYK